MGVKTPIPISLIVMFDSFVHLHLHIALTRTSTEISGMMNVYLKEKKNNISKRYLEVIFQNYSIEMKLFYLANIVDIARDHLVTASILLLAEYLCHFLKLYLLLIKSL